MIKIYNINDKLLMQAEVTSAAKREQEMSKSDYISLSFSAAEKVILPVSAYINYTYKIDKVREVTRKFLLLESYEPIQTDECSWKYTPQFQHPKMILSKTPFFIYTRNSQNVEVKQNVWSFVGTTSALAEKIKDFLNKDLMFGECGWKVIFQKVTANTVNVSFSDNDFISALTAITNAIGDNCEWHIDYDDEIIYIGKVLVGATPVVLEVGKNVGVPNISNSKESYYNAFSIFGGTRNITQVNSKGENVSSGNIRLQLDKGNGTITIDGKECSYSIDKYSTLDLRVDKIKEPLFTKVLDFSQIFPSLNTYVYNVRGRVKYVLDENNEKIPISYNTDGSVKEYKTFTVWYMRLAYPTTEKVEGKTIINTTVDDGVTHYWYDFEVTDDLLINGKNIGCSFEPNFNTGALSTPLAGRGTYGDYVGFELTYHKEASSSHSSDDVSKDNFSVLAGDYEIIYQEDNEVIIPTNAAEMLIPRGESMPSLKCNITVLYNIAMADTIYYEDAQNRLLEKAKEEIVRLLSDMNNYEVKSYSDVFLEDNPQLQIGQNVTYKDGHGYELATRVLKLSTNIDFGFVQTITLGNQVIKGTITQLKEDVQTIIASGGSSGNGGGYSVSQLRSLIAKYGSDNFLSKQFDDTAHGTITWEKIQKLLSGLLVGNSNSENGGSWTPDTEGRSHLITDYLEVRMKAIFEELVVKKTSTIGGKEIVSPAGGVVAHKVEEVTVTYNNVSQKAYRCYFLAEQEGDAVDNDFAIGDQVRSESFNVQKGTYHKVGNHFYWRLVIGRDEEPVELEGKKYHYIDLSDTDCATASDVPAKGDVLNQCGNRTDVDRQNCLIFSAVDTYSPSVSLYHGINSYSFANKEYVEYGVNKQTNKAFYNVYGDMYVGDRPTKENGYEGSSYIKYDSAAKQVSVKGKISAKSTVDGKELSQYIKENSAGGLTEEQVNNLIKNSQVIADLQNQVDGAIETWFYDGVPTLKNAPASSWTSDKDKDTHLGDLYYDNKTGKAYRFAKDGNTYKWTIITDTDIAKALSDASKAQETADGKMKVFSTQPTPPYQVGDIWVNATYPTDGSTYKNEVLRCQTLKAAGSPFAIADWIKASKYTDDTVANAAKAAAEKAQKAAEKAQGDISKLGTTVTTNKKAFDSYVTDGYLEPSEIAAMAQDSKRLEDAFAAAEKSYNEVKGAEVLKSTKELTDLNTAFTTLSTAKKELITYLSDISTRYNAADTNGKAAIVSAVGTKFTNFQSAYSAFYDKLGLANAYITSKIYGDLGVVIGDVTSLAYLKKALMDAPDTEINGGLVLTSLIGLRDTDGNTTAGINGITEKSAKGGGVAAWFGGEMVDKDYNDGSKTPANTIFRFDGSGYVAGGAIWWGTDGRVHADPTSFIISEKNLGAYLTFFEPTWKSGSNGTNIKDLVALTPQAPFTTLSVSNDLLVEGKLKLGSITLSVVNGALKIDGNVYSTGGMSAYGEGTSNGGGLNGSIVPFDKAKSLTAQNEGTEIASAWSIKKLYDMINSIDVTGQLTDYLKKTEASTLYQPKGNYLTSHQDISGKSDKTHTHSVKINGVTKTIAATGGTAVDLGTYLTSHQSLAAYLKSADAEKTYSKLGHTHAFSEITGKPTTLAGYGVTDGVNAVSVTGNGNAVTSASIDGHTLTLTKGSTFSLSGHTHTFASLTSKPTTIAGYGITDAYTKAQVDSTIAKYLPLAGGTITGVLTVNGIATFKSKVAIGDIYIINDGSGNLYVQKTDGKTAANFYATGGITAYVAGTSTSGGGGLNASVISYARIIEGSYTDADLTSIPNAYAIKALSSRIDNIATELGGLSLSWNNITGKPSTFAPSAHTHKWAEITDRITKVSQLTNDAGYLTAHQSLASYYTKAEIDAKGYTTNKGTVTSVALTLPTGLTCATKTITTSGTFAISLASGYSIPTTAKQTAWDGAVSAKHTHSNKSVLDGITSTKVTRWDSAYDWYALMTTDEETADGVINKWNEVVSFLANIAQTNTLSGIVDGINKSISDEVTRAKKAEGVNASGISTNKTSITTLQGYFTSGSAKKALQLTNTRKLWGNSFNGTADINGSIIVPDGKYISIGNIKMEYDATNKALKITNTTTNEVANLYTSGGVSAYGVGTSSSSGGGLNGSVKSYADALKLTSESLSEIASAYSIKQLSTRITSLEGGSATSISVSGGGNAVTSVTKNGTTISVVKGSTFLTSHQSLSAYLKTENANNTFLKLSGGTISNDLIVNGSIKTTKLYLPSIGDGYIVSGVKDTNGSDFASVNCILKNWNSLGISSYDDIIRIVFNSRAGDIYLRGKLSAASLSGNLSWSYITDRPSSYTPSAHTHKWAEITDRITKVSQLTNDKGYLTAHQSLAAYLKSADAEKTYSKLGHTHAFSEITGKPTTLSGFGITDGLRSVTQPSGSNVFVTGISTSGTAITYTKSYTKKSLSAVGTSGWTNASIDGNIIPDMSFIAYWNGAYSGTSSNLAYCNKGAFGSFAIKNSLAFSELTSKPTTISGYGITDAYTKSQVDAIAAKYLPLTGGTLTGQLKIVASALNGAYNGLLIGDDCYIGDCNIGNTIGLMGVGNNNAGMVKFGKGGMQFGYNGSNHIASTTAQWTNLNADLLDGWHKDNIVWSGAVNSNTANLSHYWAKLFDITVTDNRYDDRSFTFLFSNGYNDTYSVVVLRIRQNGANGSGVYYFNISLRELVGNMSSRLRVYYNNATGNVQLWGNCQGQYGSLSYTIIKKTGRTSADFTSQGTLVTNTSFSAAQSLPATTGDSHYTLLDGATRIGIVKQADQLVTARSLWGQSFNGTANVSGALSGATTISASNTISTTLQNGALKIGNKSTPISAIDEQVIFNTGGAIRFGETAWDWNQWAGLKYDHSSKTVYLGIADGSIFNANSAQSGGVINLKQGISSVYTPTLYAGGDIYHTGVYRMLWKNSKASRYLNVMNISQDDNGILTIGYGNFSNNKNVVLEGYNLNFRVGNDSGTKSMWLNYNNGNPVLSLDGNFYATGGVTAYKSSDERLKHDIHGVDSLAIIKAMGGTVAFRYNADNKDSIGWIAQRVLHNTFMQDLVEKDDKGFLKINYWSPKLIAVAFGAIEQVDDEVSRLKARVVFLESEVQRLSGKQGSSDKKRLDNKNINLLN